jgi:hypothetical protein
MVQRSTKEYTNNSLKNCFKKSKSILKLILEYASNGITTNQRIHQQFFENLFKNEAKIFWNLSQNTIQMVQRPTKEYTNNSLKIYLKTKAKLIW